MSPRPLRSALLLTLTLAGASTGPLAIARTAAPGAQALDPATVEGGATTAAGLVHRREGRWWLYQQDGRTQPLDLPALETLAPLNATMPAWLAAAAAETGELMLLAITGDGSLQRHRPALHLDWGIEAVCGTAEGDDLQLFLGDGDGLWQHWWLRRHEQDDATRWQARHVRTLHTGPDSEHCAVTPRGEHLWIAEAGVGLWHYGAAPEASRERRLIDHDPDFEPVAVSALPNGVMWLPAGADDEGGLLPAAPPRTPMTWGSGFQARTLGESAGREARPTVHATVETVPVKRTGDAADDPAVWPTGDAGRPFLVLGTDKQSGLGVYGPDGARIQHLPVGRLNNVDLRPLGRDEALVVATDRTHRRLAVFRLGHGDEPLVELDGETPLSGLGDPYGVCLYGDAENGFGVFVNDTEGRVEHHRLVLDGDRARLERVAVWRVNSQPEGCVVDDERELFYLGEEVVGVWRYPLDATTAAEGSLIAQVEDGPLIADIEGLARIRSAGRELLVVSNQGDDSYAVLDVTDATEAAQLLGTFRIGGDYAAGIDGASETDGLALAPGPLGESYPEGLLVVQDGRNRMPPQPQNFKYVDWSDVLEVLRGD